MALCGRNSKGRFLSLPCFPFCHLGVGVSSDRLVRPSPLGVPAQEQRWHRGQRGKEVPSPDDADVNTCEHSSNT